MSEDVNFFNRRIMQFFTTIELPAGEIRYIQTRKNVQLWVVSRPMTMFEKKVFMRTENPRTVIHPILKAGQEQVKNAYTQAIEERYTVRVEQMFLFDMWVDPFRQEFFQPIVTICTEPINKAPVNNQFEEVVSRNAAKCLRGLLGKGPQWVKVFDFGDYIMYWFAGILTEELREHMIGSSAEQNQLTNLFSFSLEQAVHHSLASVERKSDQKYSIEDYHNNEVAILVASKAVASTGRIGGV